MDNSTILAITGFLLIFFFAGAEVYRYFSPKVKGKVVSFGTDFCPTMPEGIPVCVRLNSGEQITAYTSVCANCLRPMKEGQEVTVVKAGEKFIIPV